MTLPPRQQSCPQLLASGSGQSYWRYGAPPPAAHAEHPCATARRMDIGDHSDKPAIMATEHYLTVFLPETCFLRVVARDFKLFYVFDTSDKPYHKNSFTDVVVQVVSKIAGSSGDAYL